MAVEIVQFNDREILVNDKLVLLNIDGQWEAKIELTPSEERALKAHLRSLKWRIRG
ncbi:MAG TPA: hypothetical protein VFF15_08210 [Flavobacteriaceae bacterium]|nr:hypothetical protein [Flavobacteriaceae bacterium]